jgi:hypothetical protein
VLTFGYDVDTLKLSGVSQLSLNHQAAFLAEELLRFRPDSQVAWLNWICGKNLF